MEGPGNGEPLEASRLAGFSDGVFGVASTLLVLNLQVPSENIPLRVLVKRQAPGYVMFHRDVRDGLYQVAKSSSPVHVDPPRRYDVEHVEPDSPARNMCSALHGGDDPST